MFGSSLSCFAQSEGDSTQLPFKNMVDLEKHVSILTGYNFWRDHYAELGLAINEYGRIGHHPAAWAYFLSTEVKLDKEALIGPKVGIWIGGGAAGGALGLNLIYYTDFDESSVRLRPEIGIGFGPWKVVYGYNIPMTNKDFKGVNTNNIGIAVLFSVKKLKTTQR